MNNKTNTKKDAHKLLAFIQFSVLLAIEIIFCFTPLGTLPALGPLSATLSHVPVIVTAVVMGPWWGSLMGFAFGACSFIYWTFVAPGAFSFIYTPFYSLDGSFGNPASLIICFLPRILIGFVAGMLFKKLKETKLGEHGGAILAGLCGSLTNTLLVLGGIWLFFSSEYLALVGAGKAIYAILGLTVLTNGIPEAVIGALVASFVAVPVARAVNKHFRR